MNKIIALDVDGVLNNVNTPDSIDNWVGIEDKLVKRLARIVEVTGADIILTSTWKYDFLEGNIIGEYLANKLNNHNLIIDYISEGDKWEDRGKDLLRSLDNYYGVNNYNYVILDDEVFDYFRIPGMKEHLVLTNETFGLTEENVEQAISILNCV